MKVGCWLVLMLASISPMHAQAPHATATDSKLIALENAWNQAQVRRDTRVLNSLVGEHFIYTDTDGSTMNKSQFLLDAQNPDYKATSATNDQWKIDVYDNTAVVTGRYHTKGTIKGKPFDHYGRFTDTWIFIKGEWQCVASHTTMIHP